MGKTSEHKQQTHIAINDIVGLSEIAERTSSSARAVWNHTRRYNFPKPIVRVSNTPLWDWNEVKGFYEGWEPSKGGWHTHKAQRETTAGTSRRRPRRQFMEGDDDNTRPKARAKK